MKNYKKPFKQLSKILTRKLIKANDVLGGQYSFNKNITFKTSMLRSDLCDYSDAYIVVNGTIDLSAATENKLIKQKKMLR